MKSYFPNMFCAVKKSFRILNEAGGSLVSHSKKRNGCFDFEGGHNYAPISFKPGRAAEGYQKSLKTIVKLAQKFAGEDSNCAVQFKRRISWRILKDRDVVERTVLFCRHLDHQQLSKFAGYLTKSNINFFFPFEEYCCYWSLWHRCKCFGAINALCWGSNPNYWNSRCFQCVHSRSWNLCSGSQPHWLPSVFWKNWYPFQLSSANTMLWSRGPPYSTSWNVPPFMNGSSVNCQVFNFQVVTCVNEEQIADEYLQFRVPSSNNDCFPSNHSIGNRNFRIDHALPFSTPYQVTVRPPNEQTVHEHWKLSVLQTSTEKKGHLNVIEKIENNPGSRQRFYQASWTFFEQSWLWHQCLFWGWTYATLLLPERDSWSSCPWVFHRVVSCFAGPWWWTGRCLW